MSLEGGSGKAKQPSLLTMALLQHAFAYLLDCFMAWGSNQECGTMAPMTVHFLTSWPGLCYPERSINVF